MGEVNEDRFIEVLRRYLPKRYSIDSGIVLDSRGTTSQQIDAIVYDNQYTPTLLDQESHRFVPAEAVYAIFEVKPAINKTHVDYAAEKARSVRRLHRTSVSIRHAGGTFPPKPLHEIIAAIVATRVAWREGFRSPAFARALRELRGDRSIDAGLAVSGGCFDVFDGSLHIGPSGNGLTYFLFRLLEKLQSLGTVPATDWSAYGKALRK